MVFLWLLKTGGCVHRSKMYQADRRLRRVAVGAIVRGVECRPQCGERLGTDRIERHFEMIALPRVADIGEVAHRDGGGPDLFVIHERRASLIQCLQAAPDLTQIEFLSAAWQGRRCLMLDGRYQKPCSRQYPRMAGDEHARDAKFFRKRAGMQPASTAQR